jgi:ABC-type transport system substrate-binding protein
MLRDKIKVVILCSLLTISILLIAIPFPARSQETLFSITLTTPSTNPSRQAWAEVIEGELQNVGIDAERQIQDWVTIYDRALDPPPEIVGKTYDEGGFDCLFVGYGMNIDPDPFSLYHSSQTPPGQNYYNWENDENDRLCVLLKETIDLDELEGYAKEWQELAYEEQVSITIKYDQEGVVIDPTALESEPFFLHHYPNWPRVQDWKLKSTTTQDTIVIAQTGPAPAEGLNLWLSTSYYDSVVAGAVLECLTKREDLDTLYLVPALATNWVVADVDKTWTVNLRQGVKWHDGVEFTAEDVKFTFDAAMADELASQQGGFVREIIGSPDNIEIVDNYTLKFHLPAPYAFFASNLLAEGTTGWILPKHVLEDVPYDEWRTHSFNTGVGTYTSNGQTFSGPIGTGPYIYESYDPITFTNTMNRNDEWWGPQPDIKKYVVVFIEGSDPAITALKNGEVDVLDAQYTLQAKLESIEPSWGEWISYDAFGCQELGINMKHPILGTGVDTPLGQQDPSRAAEAARYVRQAISYLVPRQSIIDTIIDGFGKPGVNSAIAPLMFGYDPSLEAYSYDPEYAKSLLAAAGYDTGVPPPSEGFLEEYGLYVAVAIVVVVVAIGAVYFIRRRQS